VIGINENFSNLPSVTDLISLTSRIFAEDGWMTSVLGLEHRPEQEQMALATAQAFSQNLPLLFEAGTGVGKSLAYLLPAIIKSIEEKRPCIVSTHTISLQEQVQQKDLQLCRHLFSKVPELEPYAGFKSTVLVGKGNYLCPGRLAQAIANKTDLFPSAQQNDLQRVLDWSYKTNTGLLQELNPPPSGEVWDWVNADGSGCSRKHCSPNDCHYQKARAQMRASQVIVVNHSLLFALINAGGFNVGSQGILLPNDFAVIDEAHTMPEVATQHFGLRISSYGLDRQLKMIFNPKRKTGLLKRLGNEYDRLRIKDAIEASEQFFGFIRERLLQKQAVVRLREEGWTEATLNAPLKAVVDSLEKIANQLDDGRLRDDVQEHKGKVNAYYNDIRRFINLAEEEHVHWLERGGRKGQIVNLRTAPIDVAPDLRETIFRRKTSAILTSATLAVASQIEPFQRKVGAEEEEAHIVNSPFDFNRNMRIYIASDIPQPSPRDTRLAIDSLINYIRFCSLEVSGGSLVLFTSYSDMNKVANELESVFLKENRPFFVQGRDFNRTEMTERFRESKNGILFGTDSFWTGVDVPGPALSQVILTRLPFDVPTHPITEAKSEWIRNNGGNPFADLNLPEALIKFRQGIGRLIRNKEDRGIITILDSRILFKSYGRQFLESLPKNHFEQLTHKDRNIRFEPFD
jgi:ATP-dependent DNA helicase DinG